MAIGARRRRLRLRQRGPAPRGAAAALSAGRAGWSPTASGSPSSRTAATRAAELWLSDGWARVREEGWEAPLYWARGDDGWLAMGLDGPAARSTSTRRCCTSATTRPTPMPAGPASGCPPRRSGSTRRRRGPKRSPSSTTRPGSGPPAPTSAYPGFAPAAGAVGEYNGKFMMGQMTLRGGASITPPGHARATYRNFFYPHQRWMFSGVRLAEDAVGGARARQRGRRRRRLPARRARGPGADAEVDPAEVVLRRARLGAVRGDHRAAGILSDPHRDRAADAASRRSSPRASRTARC